MKTIIVAEIGSNWEGSITKAAKLIRKCKESGADAIKFQMWRASDLYSEKHPNWNEIKKSELTFKKASRIKKIADDNGIEFFCSAFYPKAVEFLETIDVKQYKIASRTCLLKDPYALETLQQIAETKKPVIISMGMGGNRKKIENFFDKNQTTFCYCISEYPLDFKKINWSKAKKYDGFSDHTMSLIAPIIFAVLKRQQNAKKIIIEKHVKLENSQGPDALTSIDIKKLELLVSYIRTIETGKFKI